MSIDLDILGIRKIKKEEARVLKGKTLAGMEECEYFTGYFPDTLPYAEYRCFSRREFLSSDSINAIKHMCVPVPDADGEVVYVCWIEILGSYCRKVPEDAEQIEALIEAVNDIMDWDQEYHVVPYSAVKKYCENSPSVSDEKKEIIAFLYG